MNLLTNKRNITFFIIFLLFLASFLYKKYSQNQYVTVSVIPKFEYKYVTMSTGVLQHIDREYTYDIVPNELQGGLLFQGIHEPPKGTKVQFELLKPAKVYFFFHYLADGGYTKIFQNLPDWQQSKTFPQYDIHNGDHGKKMVMYELDAKAGIYNIPATTSKDAAFNILFQFYQDSNNNN